MMVTPVVEIHVGWRARDPMTRNRGLFMMIIITRKLVGITQPRRKNVVFFKNRRGGIKFCNTFFLQDKRAPVFALELMFWCWAQNPEERPSSSQLYSISSSPEFPRLLDVLTFDETLRLSRCITTRSRDYTGSWYSLRESQNFFCRLIDDIWLVVLVRVPFLNLLGFIEKVCVSCYNRIAGRAICGEIAFLWTFQTAESSVDFKVNGVKSEIVWS